MDIYLPVAEMSINAFWLLGLGLVVGFLSGLFGVGGGFMLTPLLTFMGLPPTIAVGTQASQLAGTSLSGAMAHWRRRNIDVRMGFILTVGSFLGTGVGVQIFKWLKQIGQINLVIVLCYVALLSAVGLMMFFESAPGLLRRGSRVRSGGRLPARDGVVPTLTQGWGADGAFAVDFHVSNLRVNVLLPIGLGIIGGLLVALLGVGGGFVLVPAMIYLLKMPPALVNGTSLFQIIFTTAFASVLQAVSNHSVDVVMAVFLLIGSVVSVPMGTRLASHLRPEVARLLMSLLILAVAGKLIFDLFTTPGQLFAVETRLL
ncbi:MAG: sulfite exporter TauE/SafE family protein [Alphaproteobacteria bacterium]|nr:sulfite exporter TauE/SafE family protein [Alphaproteobacteria bacterium]